MVYLYVTSPDGYTTAWPTPDRFIVNDTPYLFPSNVLETLMTAWERSPRPPSGRAPMVLTPFGLERARQQLLKERLRETHKST